MKPAIALRGGEKVGKSSSIRMAYEMLLEQHPNLIIKEKLHRGKKDISVIIIIKGVLIGIESQGDPNKRDLSGKYRLAKSLETFKEKNCDLILCAARASGTNRTKPVEEVEKLEPEYSITWLQKKRAQSEVVIGNENRAMAEKLFSELRKYIP